MTGLDFAGYGAFMFEWIIGVDQTGRVDARNRPAKLPYVALRRKSDGTYRWHLPKSRREYLPALSVPVLRSHFPTGRILVAVDCVLGLPGDLTPDLKSLWYLMKKAALLRRRAANREVRISKLAEKFFSSVLTENPGTPLLRREEIVLRAQTVFSPVPYQRNIQSGTFRIWSELASTPEGDVDFHVFGYPGRKNLDVILWEGYPSAVARSAGKSRIKNPPGFFPSFEDQNLRDAAWLAYAASRTPPKGNRPRILA